MPAIEKPVGLAVKVSPPTARTDGLVGMGIGIVLAPTTRADVPKETGIPAIVTGAAPGMIVLVPMTAPEA